MSKQWSVTLPITGYVVVEVETDDDGDEEDAIETALSSEVSIKDVQEWETLRRVNQGNVCYCMSPWEAEAECLDDED